MKFTLPTDSAERKEYPMFRGLLAYFAAALAGVARHSFINNEKHNPGEPMHHARGKSTDHSDCIIRHAMDIGDMLACAERIGNYDEGAELILAAELLAEANALAWRALAWSQELHEQFGGAPLAPGARLPANVPEARGHGCLTPDCTNQPAYAKVRCESCIAEYLNRGKLT